jgi:hypothetical protein
MAMTLHLEDTDAEILAFALDCTIQQWKDQQPGQLKLMTMDPSLDDHRLLLEAADGYDDLIKSLTSTRHQL